MPWSIDTDVAFVVVHASIEQAPARIVPGVAVNVKITGASTDATMTVVSAVSVMPLLALAVSVYVVVEGGVTVAVPVAGLDPTP